MTNRNQVFILLLLFMSFSSTALAQGSAPEIVVSVGHSGAPQHAAFVGHYLATAAWSNVAIIDLADGHTIGHLPQGAIVLAMEANPAGDLLAVGSCGHAIQLWNLNSLTLVRRFALTQECAETLSFSPDGAFLATGAYGCCSGKGGGLQIWDVRTGNLAREFAGNSGILHVAFSGNGKWVAGVDQRGKATVFEWPSGRQLRTYEGLEEPGSSRAVLIASRDGRYLSWLGSGLRVWDVTSGNEIPLPGAQRVEVHDFPPGGPERQRGEEHVLATTAEFLNDGRLAYVDGDKMVVGRLPNGPQQVISLPEPKTEFFGDLGITKPQMWLKIRRDGLLLGGSRESRTIVWDVAAARLRELIAPALMSPASLQWSSSRGIVWADLESGVQGWDNRLGKPAVFRILDSAAGLAVRPDGAQVAVAGLSSIYILDVAKHRTVASRKLAPAPSAGVAFSPDGLQLAFASPEGFGVFDGELRPQKQIAPLDNYMEAERVAFSPNGRWDRRGPERSAPRPTSLAGRGIRHSGHAGLRQPHLWTTTTCIQWRLTMAR